MRVFFLRDEKKFPVGCVASHVVEEVVYVGVSVFNPRDEFSKDRGREVAIGRMEAIMTRDKDSGPFAFILAPKGKPKRAIMEKVAGEDHLPNQVRRAAKAWLKR